MYLLSGKIMPYLRRGASKIGCYPPQAFWKRVRDLQAVGHRDARAAIYWAGHFRWCLADQAPAAVKLSLN
jgi:hypothetical protein